MIISKLHNSLIINPLESKDITLPNLIFVKVLLYFLDNL